MNQILTQKLSKEGLSQNGCSAKYLVEDSHFYNLIQFEIDSFFLFCSQDIETVEEIALYVQHDEYVQQVIDEQFLVHCKEGQPHASVSYQKDNPMSKTIDQVSIS